MDYSRWMAYLDIYLLLRGPSGRGHCRLCYMRHSVLWFRIVCHDKALECVLHIGSYKSPWQVGSVFYRDEYSDRLCPSHWRSAPIQPCRSGSVSVNTEKASNSLTKLSMCKAESWTRNMSLSAGRIISGNLYDLLRHIAMRRFPPPELKPAGAGIRGPLAKHGC